MSTNAQTWFYTEPEHQGYLISERLNGTFWAARVVEVYWRCTQAEPPFKAVGYMGDHKIGLEWIPNEWLRLSAPPSAEIDGLVEAISNRILSFPATLSYAQPDGELIVEWHRDGGHDRWSEIQGHASYINPRMLSKAR